MIRFHNSQRTLFHLSTLNRHRTYSSKRFPSRLELTLDSLNLPRTLLSNPMALYLLKDAIIAKWSLQWQSQPPLRQLPTIFPIPQSFSLNTGTRREDIVLLRLLTGHSRLTHSHLLSRSPRPFCPICHFPLTIPHLLLECPTLSALRSKLPSQPTLHTIFHSIPFPLLLSALRDSDLYAAI